MGRAVALIGRAIAVPLAIAFSIASCSDPPARPQLLVTVTSDVALPSQVEFDTTLSAAASIDRVRIEIFASDGSLTATRDFVLIGPSTFPISFGVEAPVGSAPLVRVTGFRAAWEKLGTNDAAAIEPGVSIVRLAKKTVAAFDRFDIVLRGDCFGAPYDMASETTCVDAARRSVPATTLDDVAPALGSWSSAHDAPCSAAMPSGRICIPGGVSDVGDPALESVDLTSDLIPNAPRAVLISPFAIDQTETTIGQLRSLFASGKLGKAALPGLATTDVQCNYQTSVTRHEGDAVRCVPFATALAACKAKGGNLPTAAQWEHAARGRGQGYRYPWGNQEPSCCAAALAGGDLGCAPKTAIGSYADPASCKGVADVSRDGVVDLAGSVREWVLDAAVPLDTCTADGLATDPSCTPTDHAPGSTKGGSTSTPLTAAESALRRGISSSMQDVGFRCVY